MSMDGGGDVHRVMSNGTAGKEEGKKRRTFLGMHIGGSRDKDKEDKSSKNRRQSVSDHQTNPNPISPPPLNHNQSQSQPPTFSRTSFQQPRSADPIVPPNQNLGMGMERVGSHPDMRGVGGPGMVMGMGRNGSTENSPRLGLGQGQGQGGVGETFSDQGHGAGGGGRFAPMGGRPMSVDLSNGGLGNGAQGLNLNGNMNGSAPGSATRTPPLNSPLLPPSTGSPNHRVPGASSPQIANATLPHRRPSKINPALSRVFQPLMDLIALHSKKMYAASPPEIEMIFARTPQGGQPKAGPPGSPRNDWEEVWMQLSGTSLSVWSMRETREADKRGERVPPTYYNVTDSSLELLAPLPPPPHRADSHPHPYVFSLNTAGSNRILLSSPTESNLSSWVSALRLAAWEKSRIEEIYTGHLIRTFIGKSGRGAPVVPAGEKANWNEPDSPLVKGRMEGWVRVRVMGGTEWKRLWLVLHTPVDHDKKPGKDDKKRRSLFGFGSHSGHESSGPAGMGAGVANSTSMGDFGALAGEGAPSAVFYAQPPPKGTTKGKVAPPAQAVLTVSKVTQAYAVFPEHLEVITSSNLLKVVGNIAGDMVVVEGRPRLSGWAMIMPEKLAESTGGNSQNAVGKEDPGIVAELLKWVVGFHDAFALYGRPKNYAWEREDPGSLFFGYTGQANQNPRLFVDPSQALEVDYRQDVISSVRQSYASVTARNLRQGFDADTSPRPSTHNSDTRKPEGSPNSQARPNLETSNSYGSGSPDLSKLQENGRESPKERQFYLPPLPFPNDDSSGDFPLRQDTLTPITERSDVGTSRSPSMATLATLEKRKAAISQSSQRTMEGSGSGSTKEQYLARRGSMGQRLEAALVAEVNGSPAASDDAHSNPANADSRGVDTTPRPPSPRRAPTPPAKNERRNSAQYATAPVVHDNRPKDQPTTPASAAPSTASAYSQAGTSYDKHVSTVKMTPLPTTVPAPPLPLAPPIIAQPVATHPVSPPAPGAPSRSPVTASPNLLAPKPRKVSEQFDEQQVLLDNQYLVDSIQLHDTEKPKVSPQAASFDSRVSENTSLSPVDKTSGNQRLGRRPSGARANPSAGRQNSHTSSSASIRSRKDSGDRSAVSPAVPAAIEDARVSPVVENAPSGLPHSASMNADALAAMQFIDSATSPIKGQPPQALPIPPLSAHQPPPQAAFRSSFAPTQSAKERKERAEEAEKRKEHALTKPGRRGGRKAQKANWSASSDEESEEEEEEDSDDNKSEDDRPLSRPASGGARRINSVSPLPPQPQTARTSTPPILHVNTNIGNGPSGLGKGHPAARPLPNIEQRQRVSRTLPAIPGNNGPPTAYETARMDQRDDDSSYFPAHAQDRSTTYSAGPASNTSSAHIAHPHQDLNQVSRDLQPRALPQPRAPARSNLWNSALDAPHTGADPSQPSENPSGKFVTIEPSAHLTKAFTPHGLLQAGLQDKEDRSAKRQEELAKESGASLVNVPGKAPEPQMGLLGAITAHERDRKGAGGLGAALTERERDKRLAEDRQRQIDELQSLQRQTMMMGGGNDPYSRPMSAYGGGGMMSPIAYGNPSMFWQQPMNPYAQQQAMFAAQMAYQNSMYMAMSAAGSQAGDMNGMNMGGGSQAHGGGGGGGLDGRASPMMSPGGMGMGMPMGMPMANPYMSMYGGFSGAPSMPGFGQGMPGSPFQGGGGMGSPYGQPQQGVGGNGQAPNAGSGGGGEKK